MATALNQDNSIHSTDTRLSTSIQRSIEPSRTFALSRATTRSTVARPKDFNGRSPENVRIRRREILNILNHWCQLSLTATSRRSRSPNFTLFPQLPAEIRIKIWRYYLDGPRIISIKHHDHITQRHQALRWNKYLPPTTASVLRCVNREARCEAMKRTYGNFPNAIQSHKQIYINFEVDILYFRDSMEFRLYGVKVPQLDFSNPEKCFRRIAVDVQIVGEGRTVIPSQVKDNLRVLKRIPCLEEILFVMNDRRGSRVNFFKSRVEFCEAKMSDFRREWTRKEVERILKWWAAERVLSGPVTWLIPRITFVGIQE